MEAEVTEILLGKNKPNSQGHYSLNEASFQLKSFSSGLRWVLLDYSSIWRAGLSWSIFFLLNIGVPLVSHFVFSCNDCDRAHQRPFDSVVQLSFSGFAALSFISLSSFARKYGLRRFLFLDKLCEESEKVRDGYSQQIHRSMKLLSSFVLPCFIADSAYKIWWFSSGETQIPYLYSMFWSKIVVCALLMCSWLYRTTICFLVCLLFRLMCYLQILRLEDFAQVFSGESDVATIMIEHLRIRRNLRVISHRFRRFILSSLILVTMSQFFSLLVTTKPSSTVNFFNAGELAVILLDHLCSMTLVTGLVICLRSAAKITHKAQAITSLASKWHVCATVDSFNVLGNETPTAQITSARTGYTVPSGWDTDNEEGDADDILDNTNPVPISANTLSYQKRQALVTYFEHNKAGITVYGFILDRIRLRIIILIQLTLTLWILKKTINIT